MSVPQIQSDIAEVVPADMPTERHLRQPLLRVQSFGLTHPGKVRTNNEDQFLIARLDKTLHVQYTSLPKPMVQHSVVGCHLFVVADGMGGHAAGEQASALAINSVERFLLETFEWFSRCKGQEGDQVLAEFQTALGQANAKVLSESQRCPEWHGMGTTLTLALSFNAALYIAHAGDSRAYLLREGKLYRLTNDHTLVGELARNGLIDHETAAHHKYRHMVTNVVGGDSAEVKVEVHKLQLEPDDCLLLCSDGLTEMVSETDIGPILLQEREAETAARVLLTRALEAGGKDNVTAVVARFETIENN